MVIPLDSRVDISIVIVNWNTRESTAHALQSILDTSDRFTLETIVVDNGSTDQSAEHMREHFPHAQLIENRENVGFARANNQGMHAGTGRFVLLLNSDALLTHGAVGELMNIMEKNPRAAAVGPMLLNPDSSFQAGPADFPSVLSETLLAFGVARRLRAGYYPGYPPHAREGRYDWVGGACLLLRRTALDEIGFLDERYFMYSEETDWCYRVRRGGWDIWYVPSARVIHYGGASTRQAALEMRAQLYQSKLQFFRAHYPRWQVAWLRWVFALNGLAKKVQLAEQRSRAPRLLGL